MEFHFHWGIQGVEQYLPGSEHSIDGEKQAMEVGETVRGLRLLLWLLKILLRKTCVLVLLWK